MHLVRAALKYVTDKDSRAVAADLKKIDQAATVLAAEQERDPFAELWGENEPPSVKPWCLQGADMIVRCEFPAVLRQAIATTNVIASVNRVMRKDRRHRQQDPQAESALQRVSLAIPAASQQGTMPIVGGQAALHPFAILCAERMPVGKMGTAILVPNPPDTKRFTSLRASSAATM